MFADGWQDEPFCYVTTIGRRTGRPHTIEIWFAGGTLYLLAGDGERSDTVRNVAANPAARVRIGRATLDARGRVVTAAREAALARRLVPAKYAEEEEGLEEWASDALPVAFDLQARAATRSKTSS